MFYDSDHVFHVAKTGNDNNGGLAQQYPISLVNDAKLTIGSALTVAASGDRIILWPGDYAESVDLLTATKNMTIIGADKELCIISKDAALVVRTYNHCRLENLSIIQTGSYANGAVECGGRLDIMGCRVISEDVGIKASGIHRLRMSDCYTEAGFIAVYAGESVIIDRSLLLATGASGDNHTVALEITGAYFGSFVNIKDSQLLACPGFGKATGKEAPLYECDGALYGIHNVATFKAKLVLNNCQVIADGYTVSGANGASYSAEDSYAVNGGTDGQPGDMDLVANNCIFHARTDQNYSKTAYAFNHVSAQIANSHIKAEGVAASYSFNDYEANTVQLANTRYSDTVHANVTVEIMAREGTDSDTLKSLSDQADTAQADLDIITGASGVVIQDDTITAAKIANAAIDNATFAADVGSTAYGSNIIALAVRKVLDELNLDHLCKVVTGGADMTTEVVDNSIISRIIASGDTSVFDPTTDSLQDIRDTASGDRFVHHHTVVKEAKTDVTMRVLLKDLSGDPKTSQTITDLDIYYIRVETDNDVTISAKADLTALASLTAVHADNKGYEIGQGYYRIDIPDAAFATGAYRGTVIIKDGAGTPAILPTMVDFELVDHIQLQSGANEITYTVKKNDEDTGDPIDGVEVWITLSGGTDVVWSGTTDANGVARDTNSKKPYLDDGTYDFYRKKSGYVFSNPDSETFAA